MSQLDALLSPRSIAVVGASRDPAKWGRRVLECTRQAGFAGQLYGVNPAVADLGLPGVTTVAALAEIAGAVDLAVLARPAAVTPDLVAECARLGVRSVLITASGFGELGGEHADAEQRMLDVARSAGMRLLGPNTFGMFVARHGINLTPREGIPTGPVALLTQSGNVAVAMYELARQAGFGFSAVAGVGNQVDVGLGELMAHVAGDPGTAAIAVYVEGLRGASAGAQFRRGLDACRAAGKPVVVLKAGRSAGAAAAIATHTGALASDATVWRAVLAEAGAIAVESTAELADVLAVATALAGRGPARRAGPGPGLGTGLGAGLGAGRTMVLTDGGGDSVMAIDALAAAGLSLARPSAATRAELDTITPPGAPRTPERNPVTLDTAGGVEDDPALLGRCARIAAADDSVDVIVVGGLFGGYPRIAQAQADGAAELVALHRSGKPVLVQSAFALARSEPVAALRHGGVPVFATMDRLARALGKVAGEPGTRADPRPAPQAAHPQPGSPAVLPVEETARLLDEHGVELPELLIVRTEAELPAAAAAAAYPACLKIADPAIAHKSDVGGVVLGLPDAAALREAAAALWLRFPGSPLLVMPSLPGGLELLVGAATDPVFGPFVLVGRGGIWAETDPDVAMVMAPADDGQARAALESLRCAPMLSGRRGTEPVDVAAIARLIAAMSHVAVTNPDLAVEANPVIAYSEGYAVADLRASRPA